MAVREIELPYAPRKAFMPFHNRTHRWACLVAHRRAGKTVAAINDMIRAAFTSKDSMPLYGYVAPYRTQAKSVVWDYLKHYSLPICKDSNEAELTVTLVNDSKIRLFGADNADAMRGLGFSGVYLDDDLMSQLVDFLAMAQASWLEKLGHRGVLGLRNCRESAEGGECALGTRGGEDLGVL